MGREPRVWQILDVGSIWMKEFASALSALAPTVNWSPVMLRLGAWQDWERVEQIEQPPLSIRRYPLQRGYARTPFRQCFPFERKLLARLSHCSPDPRESVLVCTTPFYAPLAERWPGPVTYYVTDLTIAYDKVRPGQVIELDRRLCRIAQAVCPNSTRIAEYLTTTGGCPASKITVVPNGTRASNLAPAPLCEPAPLPPDIADLPRPIAGVIGNLAANMDWVLLAEAVRQTPWLSWVLVGPVTMPIADRAQRRARAWVQAHARFTGAKPYGELQQYARCLDVAVLPYCRREPTYSGSSTRFYEHLAACRPMIATRGFAELLEKQPLVELVDSPHEMAAALGRLRDADFRDGLAPARWQASQKGTWEERARTILGAVSS